MTAPFLRWNIDEVKSLLRFTGGSLPTLDNRITPIATYLPSAEDWAWAWANDAFPDHARLKASRIKALSTKTGYVIFETAFFRAKPMDIDELCALALHELNGRTVFKVKDREPWVYYIVD